MSEPRSTPHYPPYSPTATHANRPYFPPEQSYNVGAPAYQLPSSPHRPVTLGSPLPPPSLIAAQPAGGPAPYQSMTSSPTYQIQRPYSSHTVSANIPPQYDGAPPSLAPHGHPSNRQPSLLHSPIREQRIMSNGIPRDTVPAETRPQSQDVRRWHRRLGLREY